MSVNFKETFRTIYEWPKGRYEIKKMTMHTEVTEKTYQLLHKLSSSQWVEELFEGYANYDENGHAVHEHYVVFHDILYCTEIVTKIRDHYDISHIKLPASEQLGNIVCSTI